MMRNGLHVSTHVFAIVSFLLGFSSSLLQEGHAEKLGRQIWNARFPIDSCGGLSVLPVIINGQRGRFAVDTGCTWHLADESLRGCLSRIRAVPEQPTPEVGGRAVSIHLPARIQIGTHFFGDFAAVVCTDLSAFRTPDDEPISGILGSSFFKRRVVQWDFDHGLFYCFPKWVTPSSSWGSSFPVYLDQHGCPLVKELMVGGVTESFLIDTGETSTSLAVHRWLFDALIRNGDLHVMRAGMEVNTLRGTMTRRIGRLREVTWGDFRHTDIMVTEGDRNVIGLPYLLRYCVTLDMPRQKVYLRKGASYANSERWFSSGIVLDREGGSFVVKEVRRFGPAAKAGIHAGDKIIKIDGRPIASLTFSHVAYLLTAGQSEARQLESVRDGKSTTITIRLEDDW